MNFFLTIVLDGLIQASWLFVVALGLTLVFGVLKILNIAHGSFYALGAYIAATVVTLVAEHRLCRDADRGRADRSRRRPAARTRASEDVLWPRRSGVAAGDLCRVPDPRRRHQADLGGQSDLCDAALRIVRQSGIRRPLLRRL